MLKKFSKIISISLIVILFTNLLNVYSKELKVTNLDNYFQNKTYHEEPITNVSANKYTNLHKHLSYETDNNVGNENIEDVIENLLQENLGQLNITEKDYKFLSNLSPIKLSNKHKEIESIPQNLQYKRIESNLYMLEIIRVEHYIDLIKLGIDIHKLEEPLIYLDLANNYLFYPGGTYYHEKDIEIFTEHLTDTPIIEIFARHRDMEVENYFYLYEQLKDTYVHEFGHHVGFAKYHVNNNYSKFIDIREKSYQTRQNYKWFPYQWRNRLFEQFAETYAELFLGNEYVNKSAVPNLNEKQKINFLKELRKSINN